MHLIGIGFYSQVSKSLHFQCVTLSVSSELWTYWIVIVTSLTDSSMQSPSQKEQLASFDSGFRQVANDLCCFSCCCSGRAASSLLDARSPWKARSILMMLPDSQLKEILGIPGRWKHWPAVTAAVTAGSKDRFQFTFFVPHRSNMTCTNYLEWDERKRQFKQN